MVKIPLLAMVILIFTGMTVLTNPAEGDIFTHSPAPQQGQILDISSDSSYWYMYRYLSTYYDSTQLLGVYGEVFVIGQDSTPVRFDGWFRHEKDSTLGYINSIAHTLPFRVGNASSVSLWRVLLILFSGHEQLNADLADTSTWVAELYNYQTDEKIALLDSLTTLPLLSGRIFPPIAYPDSSTSIRLINCDLSSFGFSPNDSAYIKITMSKRGSGNPGYCVQDKITYHAKASENPNFSGPPKLPGLDLDGGVTDGIVSMHLSPNPSRGEFSIHLDLFKESSFTLELVNSSGQLVSKIFSGTRGAGSYNYGFVHSTSFPSGAYFIVYRDMHSNYTVRRNLIIFK